MTLYQQIRLLVTEAVKAGDTKKSTLLKTVLGELDRMPGIKAGADRPDSDVRNAIKKFILSNLEVIAAIVAEQNSGKTGREDKLAEAVAENNVLFSLIPTVLRLTDLELVLDEKRAEIVAAKNEGAAMGMTNKFLKERGHDYFGDDVVKVVKAFREVK